MIWSQLFWLRPLVVLSLNFYIQMSDFRCVNTQLRERHLKNLLLQAYLFLVSIFVPH